MDKTDLTEYNGYQNEHRQKFARMTLPPNWFRSALTGRWYKLTDKELVEREKKHKELFNQLYEQ